MKKALLAALCFIIVSLMLVNGTFALPDFSEVFQVVAELFEKGIPEQGGLGTAVHVELISDQTPQNLWTVPRETDKKRNTPNAVNPF